MATVTPIFDRVHNQGTFDAADLHESTTTLHLNDGREVQVPSELIQHQQDGTYHLPFAFSEINQAGHVVIPVHQEQVRLDKKRTETGKVRIDKSVQHQDHTIQATIQHEDVTVERVAVNAFVEAPEDMRYDGDTLIIPVYEEVLVVEKRFRLKEELRVTRTSHTENVTETVTLREEHVTVKRDA